MLHRFHQWLLLIPVVSSVICSRTMFYFIEDPEGPNLLVVFMMTSIVYTLSMAFYQCYLGAKGAVQRSILLPQVSFKEIAVVIGIQIIITASVYVCIR